MEIPEHYIGKEVNCPSCSSSFRAEIKISSPVRKKKQSPLYASIFILIALSILVGFVLSDQRAKKIKQQEQVYVENYIRKHKEEWVASNWSPNDYFNPVFLSVTRSYKHLEFLIERADSYTDFEVNAIFSGVGDSIQRCHQNAEDYLNRMESSLSEEHLKNVRSIVSNLEDAQDNFQKAKYSSGRDFEVHFGRMKSDFKYANALVEDLNKELNTPPKPPQNFVEGWEKEAKIEFQN